MFSDFCHAESATLVICTYFYIFIENCVGHVCCLGRWWWHRRLPQRFQRVLTHWDRDKMAAFSETTLSNAFSSMKILDFRLKFHWRLFLRFQLTIYFSMVKIMAWRRPGDKPLSEPIMVSCPTHICVTRSQWVKMWPSSQSTRQASFSWQISNDIFFRRIYFANQVTIILTNEPASLARWSVWIDVVANRHITNGRCRQMRFGIDK